MQVGYSMNLLSENSHICMARSNILRTSITSTVDSLILRNLYIRMFEGQLLKIGSVTSDVLFFIIIIFFSFATGWLCLPCFSSKNKIQNDPMKTEGRVVI